MGSIYANNPQLRKEQTRPQLGNRLASGNNRNSVAAASDRSRSNKSNGSDNSAKRREPRTNLMASAMNSKFVMNTRTINHDPEYRRQREAIQNTHNDGQANIDDKIAKLQSLLKMAKGGQ